MVNRADRTDESEKQALSWGYRFLRLFTVIHPREAGTTWLLSLTMFLLFMGYYILRPFR